METIVGKTALVDLSERTVSVENTPRTLVHELLGGRGANMAYLYISCAMSAPAMPAPTTTTS